MSLDTHESTAGMISAPDIDPEVERQAEMMAHAIFENAERFLTGDRESFSAWLMPAEAVHARAANKVAFLLGETDFGKDVRVLNYAADETWTRGDTNKEYHIVRTMETVARNGSRVILAETVFRAPDTSPHDIAEPVQIAYSSEIEKA